MKTAEDETMLETITDFLADWYLVTKSLHVVSVISWMAGIFYLPRLFVYHVEQVEAGSATDKMFQTMERRRWRGGHQTPFTRSISAPQRRSFSSRRSKPRSR